MTNLMQMRFCGFAFPVNPSALSVELSGVLRETVSPLSGAVLQQVETRKKRVSGKGYFTGENAMADYLRLEALFGAVGTLFLPGRKPFSAVLNELKLVGVEDKNVVCYEFTFTETDEKPAGLSGMVYRAAGGESLWDYAALTGVSVEDLAANNRHLPCITELSAGDEVTVP